MMTGNKKRKLSKLWEIYLIFILWIAAMFLPATINQLKLSANFDIAKSRENYFYYLCVQKPVTSVVLFLLLIGIGVSCLQKWKINTFLSFSL